MRNGARPVEEPPVRALLRPVVLLRLVARIRLIARKEESPVLYCAWLSYHRFAAPCCLIALVARIRLIARMEESLKQVPRRQETRTDQRLFLHYTFR